MITTDAIAAKASEEVGLVVRAFFAFAVATGGLLGLSLANAVFVDEMVKDNNDDLLERVDELQAEVLALRDENRRQLEVIGAQLERLVPPDDPATP